MATQPPPEAPSPTPAGQPTPMPQEMPVTMPDSDIPDVGSPGSDPFPIQPQD
jgi:hypothetical protein